MFSKFLLSHHRTHNGIFIYPASQMISDNAIFKVYFYYLLWLLPVCPQQQFYTHLSISRTWKIAWKLYQKSGHHTKLQIFWTAYTHWLISSWNNKTLVNHLLNEPLLYRLAYLIWHLSVSYKLILVQHCKRPTLQYVQQSLYIQYVYISSKQMLLSL